MKIFPSHITVVSDLDDFPQVTPMGSESPTEQRPMSRKSHADYAHETEIIFALPSLMMHLETLHLQQDQEPDEEGECKVFEFEFHQMRDGGGGTKCWKRRVGWGEGWGEGS